MALETPIGPETRGIRRWNCIVFHLVYNNIIFNVKYTHVIHYIDHFSRFCRNIGDFPRVPGIARAPYSNDGRPRPVPHGRWATAEPDNVILSVFVSRTLHRTLLRGMKQAKKFPFLSITFKFSSKRSSDFRPPETSTLHAAGMLLKTQRGVLIVKNDVSFVFFLARVKQNKGVSLKRFWFILGVNWEEMHWTPIWLDQSWK